MSTTHYECPPLKGYRIDQALVFDWDEADGIVSGRDADWIRSVAGQLFVAGHPHPISYELGPEPLKSRRDMAVIVGQFHMLPDDLAEHYPKAPEEDPLIRDPAGQVIGELVY